MLRSFLLFFFCFLAPAINRSAGSRSVVPSDHVPNGGTPKELTEAWLHFHEADLCQGVEAVFIFTKHGMEVRSLIEDEKSYGKLQELLAPLRGSYNIEVQETRPPEQKKSDEERAPPPSLWQNYVLRSFLGDPVARAKERPSFDGDSIRVVGPFPDSGDMLKQRLLVYADETLAWNRKMERYARDLPSLTRVAFDPSVAPDLRAHAIAVCLMHDQNLERYLAKLNSNLVVAFPPSSGKDKARPTQPDKPSASLKTPVDRADYLSDSAQAVAQSINQFIHPEHYSVGLEELRRPGLLESLKILRTVDLDYRKSLTETK